VVAMQAARGARVVCVGSQPSAASVGMSLLFG
jgi:hypothetical protein